MAVAFYIKKPGRFFNDIISGPFCLGHFLDGLKIFIIYRSVYFSKVMRLAIAAKKIKLKLKQDRDLIMRDYHLNQGYFLMDQSSALKIRFSKEGF